MAPRHPIIIQRNFFDLGLHYYISGRLGFFVNMYTVAGNQFHHAVEMYLKGCLLPRVPMQELRNTKKFGHHLDKLWAEFRTQATDPVLTQFNTTIAELNAFEELRYPLEDDSETIFVIRFAEVSGETIQGINPKFVKASLVLEELDRLVLALYECARIKPEAPLLMPEALSLLARKNTCAEAWDLNVVP